MKEISCLEAILLLSLFLNTNHEQGISEDEISLDPSAPNCCLNTLSVIREICDHNNDSLSENHTDEHIKNMIHYALLRLKNMKFVNLKLLKGKKIYTANVDFDLLQQLIKEKSANCPRMKSYFDSIINLAESKTRELVDDKDNSQPPDTTNTERSLIRKNVAASISAAEKRKLFKHIQEVNTVCLKYNEKSYKFLPVFATVDQKKEVYLILNPLFRNEFGDNAALVFKRQKDKTFTVVTDPQTTEKLFDLAKESTNEKQ